MSKIVAINASPRRQGTSAMLLYLLKDAAEERGDHISLIHLYSHLKDMKTIFQALSESDTVVICGPCYINTYPADVTMLLEELAGRPDITHGQNLYGIIQGGMPYAHAHISGLNMLKIFSGKTGMLYKGGFIIGLGAMLDGQSLSKLPNGKKTRRQLSIFFEHILNGENSPDSVYEAALMKIPGFVARILAAMMNRRIDKTYASRGMDAYQPSPYLSDMIDQI